VSALDEGLGSWPLRRALMSPDRAALVHGDRTVTYAELAVRVRRLAAQLRADGVSAGDRVGYLGPNHPAFVETMFATHLIGAIFVPFNVRLTLPELAYQVEDSGVRLLVHAPGVTPPGPRTVALDGEYEPWLARGSAEPVDVPVSPEDTALILYTSGTTGRPKGARLSHANLVWNTVNLLVGVDVRADEVTLVSAPLFHVAALGQTFLPTFVKGGCAVLMSSWDVDGCFDLVAAHGVTMMFGVPTMFADLAAAPRWAEADLSSVRTLMCGGAAVPESLIATYQARGLVFCQGYGLTEAAPGATFLEAGESVRKIGSAGVPAFFTDVRVVRADGADAAVDEPGEVVVRGPNVSPGYWGHPGTEGWLHTGDVGRVDAEGHLYVLDRLTDMFISGGENVYPAEVENAIFAHPAVVEVAVVAVPDERWGEVGRAFVVCRPGTTVTHDELRAFLLARLAKYKIPARVEVVARLPRTGSGKVRKSELRRRA
jgi:fatty-acyl-CoA synthase